MKETKYLTSDQVAERFQVTRATVQTWARRGLIPAFHTTPSVRSPLRFRESDVERFEPLKACS